MSADAVVYALLSGAGAVTAIVNTRIYPVVMPQSQPTPAIVYEVVSAPRMGAIDAQDTTHLTRSRVQVNLLSADYVVLRTMREAVVAALQFERGSIGGVTVHSVLPAGEGPDTYDHSLRLFHRPLDFLVTHEST
jgi:hypothetical protein